MHLTDRDPKAVRPRRRPRRRRPVAARRAGRPRRRRRRTRRRPQPSSLVCSRATSQQPSSTPRASRPTSCETYAPPSATPCTSSAPIRWPAASDPVPGPRVPTCSRAAPGWSCPTAWTRTPLPVRRNCVRRCGGVVVHLDAATHDAAVALVSHVPQVAATLVAARLAEGEDGALALTGQGLRDVTRVAASDADLWVDVLTANAVPVGRILTELRAGRRPCDRRPGRGRLTTPTGAGPRCVRCCCAATRARATAGQARWPADGLRPGARGAARPAG